MRRMNGLTKQNTRGVVAPYQSKLVHLFGHLLQTSYAVAWEDRTLQQVLEFSSRSQQCSSIARSARNLYN
jgi:hypothetical protein